MALRTILTLIGAGGITGDLIADGAVDADAIASGAVGSAELAANAVNADKMDLTDAYDFDDLSVGSVAVNPAGSLYFAVVVARTTSNVSISGGAPNSLQSVSLSANDDVLLMGQSDGENGIYNVDSVGTGSNGTFTRATERDTIAELPIGMLIYNKADERLYKVTGGAIGSGNVVIEEHQEGLQVTGNGEPEAVGTGDGSTLNFDLDVASPVFVGVYVDGIAQDPGTFSVSATGGSGGVAQLQFGSGNAPANGAKIEAIVLYRT